jgi:hypothetical protein
MSAECLLGLLAILAGLIVTLGGFVVLITGFCWCQYNKAFDSDEDRR